AKFPWSFEADQQTFTLYRMCLERQTSEVHKTYAFSADSAYRDAEGIDLASSRLTQAHWGAALFAYYYYLGMRTAKDTAYRNETSKQRFDIAEVKFASMIARVQAPWAAVYGMKVEGNRVVTAWNDTPRAERDSPKMRALLKESNYFARLK